MDEQLKQRLVGAAVLVLLAVIFIPMILDQSSEPPARVVRDAPPPGADGDFSSRVVPLKEPETPLIEAERQRKSSAPPPAPETDKRETTAAAPPPATKAAAPAPAPKPAAGPQAWAVQLGSFESRRNAIALRDDLRKKGYVAFEEKARVGGNEITRVYVGPELARERAAELVKKLKAETGLKGIVVQYPES